MSDDIVTRLRDDCVNARSPFDVCSDGPWGALCMACQAADEIERLREKVQDLRMYAEQDSCEIERLRVELALATKWRDNYKLAYEKATKSD